MRAAVTSLVLASLVVAASRASAQSHVDLVPSVTFANVYDNNLFAETEASPGEMLRVRPGVDATLTTPRLNLGTFWTFDAQRSNHPDLNTFDARRHGDFALGYRTTSATTLGFTTVYDRTDTPGEINLVSGILSVRQQAHRWEISPNVVHRLGPRANVSASYDWTDESPSNDGFEAQQMHVARAVLAREHTTRTMLTAGYIGRHFVQELDNNSSHAVMAGWEHEFGPSTRMSFRAGPRVSSYRPLAAEVLAGFTRVTRLVDMAFDYWHGETIVLDIRGPVQIDNGTATLTWPFRRTFEISSYSSASTITTLESQRLTSYRQAVVGSWSPGKWYSVAADYGVDYQLGVIRHHVFSDENVLRHVFRVSLTVAPRLSRTTKSSDDPAARVKGVSQ